MVFYVSMQSFEVKRCPSNVKAVKRSPMTDNINGFGINDSDASGTGYHDSKWSSHFLGVLLIAPVT